MKSSLKIEEFAQLLLAIFLFSQNEIAWWWYLTLFFAPDIGMIGYVMNTKVGAMTYNLFHHKGIAILLYLIGLQIDSQWLAFSGLLLFGHAAFDRIFGFGLKYPDDFKHTHLGWMGRS